MCPRDQLRGLQVRTKLSNCFSASGCSGGVLRIAFDGDGRYMVCYGSMYSIFNLANQFHGGYFRYLIPPSAINSHNFNTKNQSNKSSRCHRRTVFFHHLAFPRSINEFMWLDFAINMGLGYCMTGGTAPSSSYFRFFFFFFLLPYRRSARLTPGLQLLRPLPS